MKKRMAVLLMLSLCLTTGTITAKASNGEASGNISSDGKKVVQTNPELLGTSEQLEQEMESSTLTDEESISSMLNASSNLNMASSSNPILLDGEKIGQTSFQDDIVFCEEKNGIFFLKVVNGRTRQVVFYNLETKTYETVYTQEKVSQQYVGEDAVYFASYTKTKMSEPIIEDDVTYAYAMAFTVTKYDFKTGATSSVTLDNIYSPFNWANDYATALGVDATGRIYIATIDDEMYLFSNTGTILSKVALTVDCNNFYGFDASNGNFYYEGTYNWVYWGYSHYMASVMAGNVKENTLAVAEKNIAQLYQYGFFAHKNSVKMLNDRYLAIYSGFNGDILMLLDSHNYDYKDYTEQSTSISIIDSSVNVSPINISNTDAVKMAVYTAKAEYSDDKDISSIGPKCDLNQDTSSVIVKTDSNQLREYDMQSGEKKISLNTTYPVYSFAMLGNTCVAVERQDDQFYLETFDWVYPTTFSVSIPEKVTVGNYDQISCSADSSFALDYTYESSDPKTLSVDAQGKINAWKAGTVTVRITAVPINVTKEITITVNESALSKDSGASYKVVASTGTASSTMHRPKNSTYGSVQTAYITQLGDGTYERLEYIKKQIVREVYNADYTLQSQSNIPCELALFGGFYSGKDCNFLVFGQNNTEESDDVEVFRIVKYDKNWNRLGACSIKGANTYQPFDAGSLDMTETNGKLYVYTCHTMYKSSDGYHHQANCTFVINENDMTLADSFSGVMNISYGYVSHSFNELIETDGTNIYRADLGDAYPRGIALTSTLVTSAITKPSQYGAVISIPGNTGSNYTGYSVSGLKLSDDYYMVAGNGIVSSDSNTRNIYINASPKTSWSAGATWITNYDDNSKITVYPPKLVKINANQFMLMWEEYNQNTSAYCTKLCMIDPSGRMIGDIYSTPLTLSSCEPIVNSAGKVVWYSTNAEAPVFIELNPYQLSNVQENSKGETLFKTDKTEDENELEDEIEDTIKHTIEDEIKDEETDILSATNKIGTTFTENGYIYKITDESSVQVTGVSKKRKTSISIAATVKKNGVTYKVTSIATNAFKGYSTLKKVTIGKNVTSIGKSAFYKCKKLKTVSMGGNVTTIGDKAFYGCTSLKKITIPGKTKKIGVQAFAKCKQLSQVTIKSSLLTEKNVGKQAFTGIHKKAVVKVPSEKKKVYKKWLKKKGVNGKKQKVK